MQPRLPELVPSVSPNRPPIVFALIAGARSGVAAGAWQAARARGIPCHGWCVRAERESADVGLHRRLSGLYTLGEDDPQAAVTANAAEAEAVLLCAPFVLVSHGLCDDIIAAAEAHHRPWLTVDPSQPSAPVATAVWAAQWVGPARICVAGPDADAWPEGAAATAALLMSVTAPVSALCAAESSQ